ncbi:MAG: hypothetical protein HY302_01530 [Opitutae bacterium]|nr:hypothetical protein [Opitutae bacterium]
MSLKKWLTTRCRLGNVVGAGMNIAFPLVAGRLLDRFSAQGNIAGGYALLFAGCASAYLVASPSSTFSHRDSK